MTQAMIVDSSERWASELKGLLEGLEFTVDALENRGTGWLETLKQRSVRWLFIDDQLPSRSGLKCLEKIQETKGFDGTIVFMHSLQGLSAAPLETQALARGARHILRKPFRLAELRRIVTSS